MLVIDTSFSATGCNERNGEPVRQVILHFFFFKQKTAYEIRLSLVGSEMCIRDSRHGDHRSGLWPGT